MFSDTLLFSYRPIVDANAVFMVEKEKVEVRKRKHSGDHTGSQSFFEYSFRAKKEQYKEGLITVEGEILLHPIYDEISGYYIEGFMKVKNKGKSGIVNQKGEVIIPLEYENVLDFHEGMFLAKKNNQWGIIDEKNNVVVPFQYNRIKNFSEGLALVSENRKIGYINKKGKVVIEPQYEINFLGDFISGLALVKVNNKYGFINKKNEFVIEAVYDNALPFWEDKTIVMQNGTSFFIDKKGKKLEQISKPYLWLKRGGYMRFAE